MGLRRILHASRPPGRPDLVLPARKVVVFVYACFWHRCPHCAAGRNSFLLKLSRRLPSWTVQAQPGAAIAPFHGFPDGLSIDCGRTEMHHIGISGCRPSGLTLRFRMLSESLSGGTSAKMLEVEYRLSV